MASKNPHKKSTVLVVDDEQGVRIAARRWLSREGYEVEDAPNGAVALDLLQQKCFDIVLCDVRMPKMGGLDLLQAIRQQNLSKLVIMMSAFGDSDDALDAIRRGAYDYLPKPFKRGELLLTISKAEEREHLLRENHALRETLNIDASFEEIISNSDSMRAVFRTVRKVADFNSTILLSGESGTGKELVARAIHQTSSRKDKSFIGINCGAIPEALIESELFGHGRGAFTGASKAKAGLFEEADGGTLLLDEIGELPLLLQVKLLRVLQEGTLRRLGETHTRKVDVRIIAAGTDDLSELVKQGDFREDLFYRLNVIPIHLPPLRERRGDVELLAKHFLARFNERLGMNIRAISTEAIQAMNAHHWPGNIRQLQNVIERAVVLCEGDIIELLDLPQHFSGVPKRTSMDGIPFLTDEDLSIKKATRRVERFLIEKALRATKGNRTQASKLLELSHRALLYKIRNYELQDIS